MDDKWSIDRLTLPDYSTWKFELKHLLIATHIFGYIDSTNKAPDDSASNKDNKEYASELAKTFSQVVLSVSDGQLYLITACKSAKDAWDKLQSHFE